MGFAVSFASKRWASVNSSPRWTAIANALLRHTPRSKIPRAAVLLTSWTPCVVAGEKESSQ